MEGIGGGIGLSLGVGMAGMGGMGGASGGGSGGESAAVGAAGGAGASTAAANGSAAPIGGSSGSGSNQSGGPSVMLSISPEGMSMSMGENSDLTAMLLMSLMDKASEEQQSTNGGVLALALVGATAVNAYSSIQNMK